jgi:hypothetical protein
MLDAVSVGELGAVEAAELVVDSSRVDDIERVLPGAQLVLEAESCSLVLEIEGDVRHSDAIDRYRDEVDLRGIEDYLRDLFADVEVDDDMAIECERFEIGFQPQLIMHGQDVAGQAVRVV